MTVPLRVLLISHTCQSRTEGHPRAERLACLPGVDLRVLVPDRWRHYGRWRRPEAPPDGAFALETGRVAWPWAGPAQSYLHWYPGLAGTLRRFRPDVIDLWEEPWGLVSAQVCWLRGRLLPQAKIVSETEQNISRRLPPPFEGLRRYTLGRTDYAVARSAEALQVLREKGYTGPGGVVPNAVDADLFRPLDRERCRAALNIPGFLVGYVGRLVEEKGLADHIDALRFCSSEVQCVFVGDGPFRGALEERARAAGKSGQVHFLPGRPQEELPPLMNAFDALALVSHTTSTWKEQFGRVIIEAHACATPVIGSSSGAIPGVIGAGGLVVPEKDPKAFAGAIERLRADPAQARTLGALGRAQVEAHYTWERVTERMLEIFKGL